MRDRKITLKHIKLKNIFNELTCLMCGFCNGGFDSDLMKARKGGGGVGETFRLKFMSLLHI